MKTLLHVGYPKCASTYLQKIVFPKAGAYSNIAFAPADEKGEPLRRDFDPDRFRSLVHRHRVDDLSEPERLVVSCEDWCDHLTAPFVDNFFAYNGLDRARFEFSNQRIANNLKTAFPDASVIVVLRDPIEWCRSRYKSLFRGGRVDAPFERYLHPLTETYDTAVERWRSLFGAERVLVIPYELIRADRQAFVDRITEFIRPGLRVDAPDRRVNAAPDLAREVFFERKTKRLRRALRSRRMGWLYAPARAALTVAARPALRRTWGDAPFEVPFDPARVPETMKAFAEADRKVERMTGLDLKALGYP
ncbi:sulfotransferase [Kiritimatiella glycovorans]|uniref:Sulfotransferase domain protein n=1 Tax=Kiritimatiella glycovorans TaxID=1307763 RepID=A0A0G3EGB4_9BACT|nr:sulfotransferase [Kiritimatiella glycovorans]AKJ64447.1 hypothetical protein L21SP4_01199 [Kiritimatiella glycovorans]